MVFVFSSHTDEYKYSMFIRKVYLIQHAKTILEQGHRLFMASFVQQLTRPVQFVVLQKSDKVWRVPQWRLTNDVIEKRLESRTSAGNQISREIAHKHLLREDDVLHQLGTVVAQGRGQPCEMRVATFDGCAVRIGCGHVLTNAQIIDDVLFDRRVIRVERHNAGEWYLKRRMVWMAQVAR